MHWFYWFSAEIYPIFVEFHASFKNPVGHIGVFKTSQGSNPIPQGQMHPQDCINIDHFLILTMWPSLTPTRAVHFTSMSCYVYQNIVSFLAYTNDDCYGNVFNYIKCCSMKWVSFVFTQNPVCRTLMILLPSSQSLFEVFQRGFLKNMILNISLPCRM